MHEELNARLALIQLASSVAARELNSILAEHKFEGIRKAEIERAALRANELYTIIMRDKQVHEG